MKKKKKKKRRGSRLSNVILVLVLLAGVILLAYPSFSDYWNSFHQSRAIMSYMENVGKMDTAEYEKIIQSAREYNQRRSSAEFRWFLPEEEIEAYERELNFNANGAMGYITIEKIHVQLPIYHGTSESVLQTSIGHLDWTSLPVGGEGTHCALSGHRGLPSAKLFSDLDKLTEGDVFSLSILNETLTYQVDQIRVVEPTDLADLQIVDGKDYCTLVTCTPYGINTHRLLVRGHRVANPQGDAKVVSDAMQIETVYVIPFVGVPILLLLLIMMLISTGRRGRHRDSVNEVEEWQRELEEDMEAEELESAEPEPKPGAEPEPEGNPEREVWEDFPETPLYGAAAAQAAEPDVPNEEVNETNPETPASAEPENPSPEEAPDQEELLTPEDAPEGPDEAEAEAGEKEIQEELP